MKKQFSGIIGLFAIAFLIGAALTLTIATPVAACSVGPCYEWYQSCEAGSPCPGEFCRKTYEGINSANGSCCGTVLGYRCREL